MLYVMDEAVWCCTTETVQSISMLYVVCETGGIVVCFWLLYCAFVVVRVVVWRLILVLWLLVRAAVVDFASVEAVQPIFMLYVMDESVWCCGVCGCCSVIWSFYVWRLILVLWLLVRMAAEFANTEAVQSISMLYVVCADE